MIDYEKLKKAHELAEKLSYESDEIIRIYTVFYQKNKPFVSAENDFDEIARGEDAIIAKLTELTQPEQKYKEAWYIHNGDVLSTEVLNKPGYICCDKTERNAIGRHMYETKEALIEAQIKYWQSLHPDYQPLPMSSGGCGVIEECRHESDGSYCINSLGKSGDKCKKCGGFYK